jgi:hypothetical protein
MEHPHHQLMDLLLNIQETTKEPHTLLSVKDALQIARCPQHQLDGYDYAGKIEDAKRDFAEE